MNEWRRRYARECSGTCRRMRVVRWIWCAAKVMALPRFAVAQPLRRALDSRENATETLLGSSRKTETDPGFPTRPTRPWAAALFRDLVAQSHQLGLDQGGLDGLQVSPILEKVLSSCRGKPASADRLRVRT